MNFTGRQSWANDVIATVRGNWYGDYKVVDRTNTEFQDMSGDVYRDVDLNWDVSDALSVTFGGNNIFKAKPDAPPDFAAFAGRPTETSTVMDWQGPYYYLRGVFRWN